MQKTRVQFSLGALRTWSSGLARQAHNLEVDGSNPSPATFSGRGKVWPVLLDKRRVVRNHELCFFIGGSNSTVLTDKYRWADVGVRGWLLTTYEETLLRFDSCCRCSFHLSSSNFVELQRRLKRSEWLSRGSRLRKGKPIGDGNRLERGRALTMPCDFDSRSFRL